VRTSRWRLGLIVPAGLVLLVGTLAALQYRWLGQVSDAERDAMRAALQHRATEFADEFDPSVKYGGGPARIRETLAATSQIVAGFEDLERTMKEADAERWRDASSSLLRLINQVVEETSREKDQA